MNNQLLKTYRQKNIALAIGLVLALLILYPLTISKTIALGKDIKRLEIQEQQSIHAPVAIAKYNLLLKQLDKQITSYVIDSSKGEQYLLELVSDFCQDNHLTLTSFPKATLRQKEKISVYTRKLKIEGDFIPLLKLLHFLEYRNKVGRMASVSFDSYIQRKTKEKKLSMTLYIQNCKINPRD